MRVNSFLPQWLPRARRKIMNHWPHMAPRIGDVVFKLALIISAVMGGLSIYQRTINMWAMKNLGDSFLMKDVGSRQIMLGAFYREKSEQNVKGKYAVIHFLADGRIEHPLYCFTLQADGKMFSSRAHVQRIHRGKRAANDICSWAGHIAECEVEVHSHREIRIGISPSSDDAMTINPELPVRESKRHDLVVCVAPMYIYTDWEIMLLGIETWLSLGATKIVVPIQSASTTTYTILKEYEKKGLVIIRPWPKWPVLSDQNPNGLVLSRGIEESHVNCLFYVKPWADMVVFTDIDDMFLPIDPTQVQPQGNIPLLRSLFAEHPQAGSLLFEHRDVQFRLPDSDQLKTLANFNFDFLQNSQTKQNCQVWRMKTRVVVNASRVDSVNMHETGIHRVGYVQTRIPCRKGHFYHLRHSHGMVGSPTPIEMKKLNEMLNNKWSERLQSTFSSIQDIHLNKSSTESFEDFDRCMGAINDEHWTMHVSRCLTPHVCYSRLKRDVSCVSVGASYGFHRSGSGYILYSQNITYLPSEQNCEAPQPQITTGNHFFLP